MGITRKLLSNSVYLFLDLFLANLLSIVYWFMVGRFLLPEQMGIVATATNLAILLSLISLLGLPGTVQKLIPEYIEKKEYGKIIGLARFSFKMIIASNFAIILILLLFSTTISNVIKLPSSVLILTAVTLFLTSLSTFFGAIRVGFQDMKIFFKADLLGTVANVFLTSFLLIMNFGNPNSLYLGPLIGVLIGFIIIDIMKFSKSYFFGSTDRTNNKNIFANYALPAFIVSVTGIIFSNFPIILLATLQNQEATGLYAISLLVTSLISIIPSILSQALFPITSLLSVGNRSEKQSYLLSLIFRYSVFIILPMAIFLVFFAKPLMLLFGTEYLVASSLFPPLALAAVFMSMSQIFLSNIYALGRTKLHRDIWLVSSAVFLILTSVLITLYSSEGLALAYLLSSAITLLLSYYFVKKIIKLKIQPRSLIKIVLSSLIFFSFLFVADISQFDLAIKILFVLVGGIFYLLVLVPLKFYRKEDVQLLDFIAKRLPVFKKIISNLSRFLSKHISTGEE